MQITHYKDREIQTPETFQELHALLNQADIITVNVFTSEDSVSMKTTKKDVRERFIPAMSEKDLERVYFFNDGPQYKTELSLN